MPSPARSRPATPTPTATMPTRALASEERLERLADVLSRAAAGDFAQRVDLPEGDGDVIDRICILARFLLDDLERAQGQRDREVDRLRDIDGMKSRFINTAAHELGTPLTPMRLQLHLLETGSTGPLTKEQERSLRILGRNLSRVTLLVSDMLSISRMEAGELKLRKAAMDIGELVAETSETFVDTARERGITLEHDAASGLVVDGDAARLGQVLYNLTNNALKFTPRGGHVRVRARRRGHEVVVQVQDDGIGLTADEIARLFQPFAKLADQSPHGDPGTGLGLYISRGLVERHGGLLWIESRGKGQGATVSFVIPLREHGAPAVPDDGATGSMEPRETGGAETDEDGRARGPT